MNIDEVLKNVQDFRSTLDTWGISNSVLLVAGGVAGVLFLLSLREVLSWYLKVSQVRDEMRALRAQISDLQKMMAETRELLHRGEPSEEIPHPLRAEELVSLAQAQSHGPTTLGKAEKPSAAKKFRLDH